MKTFFCPRTKSISVLKKENHGRTLQCRAKHKLSNTTLTTSKLLNIPFQPEIRSVTAEKEYYLQNETAVLQCEVISNPPALVVWRHLPSLAIVGTGSVLVTEKLEDGDEAYECIAENEVGRTVSWCRSLGIASMHSMERMATNGHTPIWNRLHRKVER